MAFINSAPVQLNRFNTHSKTASSYPNRRPLVQTPRAQDVIPPTPPKKSTNKWATNSWKEQKTSEAACEEIEFIIRPGGIVEERVSGVTGKLCEDLTETIEEALGTVITKEKTAEYYEVKENVNENINSSDNGSKWSKW